MTTPPSSSPDTNASPSRFRTWLDVASGLIKIAFWGGLYLLFGLIVLGFVTAAGVLAFRILCSVFV